MINSFTVDLEDWFCASVPITGLDSHRWNDYENRIVNPTINLLNLFAKKNIRATFFVLGWIAEIFPELIQEIEKNHEIACHSYNHRKITNLTPLEFERDIDKCMNIFNKISKSKVIGYRAPIFTITKNTFWAFDILKKYGFKYDSSVYPVFYHPDYGINNSPLLPHNINGILEVPLSCIRISGISFPVSGGGYFRLYPYSLTKKIIHKINQEGRPFIFYMHPWELDETQPKMNLNLWGKFRHYQGLKGVLEKVENLINDFNFTSLDNLIPAYYEK